MSQKKKMTVNIEDRRRTVARLYLRGIHQADIASELSVSQATISNDLKAIRTEWRGDRVSNIEELTNQELSKIAELERTYWDGWQRSVGEVVTVTEKTIKIGEEQTPALEVTTRTEQKVGDKAFLDGVMKCIDARTKLLGLSKEREPEGGTVNNTYILYSPGAKPQHVSEERKPLPVNGKTLPPGTPLDQVED